MTASESVHCWQLVQTRAVRCILGWGFETLSVGSSRGGQGLQDMAGHVQDMCRTLQGLSSLLSQPQGSTGAGGATLHPVQQHRTPPPQAPLPPGPHDAHSNCAGGLHFEASDPSGTPSPVELNCVSGLPGAMGAGRVGSWLRGRTLSRSTTWGLPPVVTVPWLVYASAQGTMVVSGEGVHLGGGCAALREREDRDGLSGLAGTG